jgi:prephenate dehydrogenase
MKIALLGMGHMGSWLAREFSRSHEVAAFDIKGAATKKIDGVRVMSWLSRKTEAERALCGRGNVTTVLLL